MKEINITWGETKLNLHAEKAVFIPRESILIISDLHLGKSGHFRKHGIAIPLAIAKNDLKRLGTLIQYYLPKQVIIAGDFFHAHANSEIDLFLAWKKDYENVNFVLVKGNHDRLKKSLYKTLGFELIPDFLELNNIIVTHDFDKKHHVKQISGHVHPGIVLKGMSKQRLRIPVFAYNEDHLLLPAFSEFTGLYTRFNVEDYTCYGLADQQIFEI